MCYGSVIVLLRLVSALTLFSFSSIHAQQLIFKSYTAQDGLVANHVRQIFQDSKGFIWFATWEGLSKYDGHKFTNFTKADGLSWNLVNDVYETADGKLYVALNNGDVDIIQHDAIVHKSALRNIVINRFYTTSENRVIAATDKNGLMEFRNGKLQKLPHALPGGSYSHLANWNDSSSVAGVESCLSLLNKRYELLSEVCDQKLSLHCLYVDSKKRLWAGTYTGLKLVAPIQQKNKQIKFEPLPPPFNIPAISHDHVTRMLEDTAGNFWLGTMDRGIVKVQPNGHWQIYSEKDGLPSSHITCLFQDREKNIWVGTSLGLAKLVTRNNISIYSTQQGLLSKRVMDAHSLDRDRILLTTVGGVQLYNKTKNRFITVPSENNTIYGFFIKNSSPLLLYGNNKLGVYDSINTTIVNSDLSFIHTAVVDDDKNLLTGADNGLTIISGNKILADKLVPHRVNNLMIDHKGFLWAGTWDKGLYRIQYSIKKNKITTSVKDLSDLLPGKDIRCLFEDRQGNIWIGTRYNGVVCLTEVGENDYRVQHWDYQQGLMATWILAIAEDSVGNIWLGSYLGIDKLVKHNTGFRVFNFSRVNNFFAAISSICPDSDNKLFFCTGSGFVLISDDQTETLPALPAHITSASLGKKTKTNFIGIQLGKKVSLDYRQNHAQFEFTAPGYINEKQILYTYRLRGSDDTAWSHPVNIYSVSYASLEPGDYRFEVRTLGWDGSNGVPAAFEFIIHPPFWQTWWFRICTLIFISGVITFFVRRRIKSIRHEAELKHKIAETEMMALRAQMNPHFIFNCLSAIDNLIQTHQQEKATTYLARFARLIRSVLESSKNNTVLFQKDFETLQLFLQLEQFRCNNKFSYELKADEELLQSDYKVPPLIVQPFVENAIHHGLLNKQTGDRRLTVYAGLENDRIKYTITDNGVGRARAQEIKNLNNPEQQSYGIHITTERIHLYNQNGKTNDVVITDLTDNGNPAGTRVEVQLKISDNN